jgi:hypothetical protein
MNQAVHFLALPRQQSSLVAFIEFAYHQRLASSRDFHRHYCYRLTHNHRRQ